MFGEPVSTFFLGCSKFSIVLFYGSFSKVLALLFGCLVLFGLTS